jgi:integrase
LTDNLRLALRPYCFGRAEGELVFARHDDPSRPISGFGVYRRFIDAAQRAGLPRIRFHDLRHTFATRAMASGRVDIYALQRLLGHAQLTTTEIYLHFQPDPDLGRILSNPWPRDDDLYDG